MKRNSGSATELRSNAAVETSLAELSSRRTLEEIALVAERATNMLTAVRNRMLEPHPHKAAPRFTTAQLTTLCQSDRLKVTYQLSLKKLPSGEIKGSGSSRYFTLAQTREWIQAIGPFKKRPEGQNGKVIAVGSFKGGVAKTTTSMTLAQGLSLRGKKVLIIDLDPQASLTILNGLLADSQVTEEQTILPLIYGDEPDLTYAPQPTYWDGIDLIPASTTLFSAEFALPQKQMADPTFEFWDVLRKGLQPLLPLYDVVIIDTPPALSYLTINAFMAADGLIVPIPPSTLDYASSTQFWSLFSELATSISNGVSKRGKGEMNKTFDFVNVLLSKVNPDKQATPLVREWIQKTYGDMVMPVEIPFTRATETASAEFGTVYDIPKVKAREQYDRFVELIDQQIDASWKYATREKNNVAT